ncbi:Eco57I restriction-modification methylase domain-containing protein [Prevotella falsenii]|uniref:Eco57I restriction-modification methylase domain-containing protein n=1 Tax=Prevotella falsenii TaxID=515414 RepID=UPI00046A07CF|nr:DNA methyltransferase [Prevotella falsenii]
MKRKLFNQYITEADFKGLFVSEMLWNNPSGATLLPEYTIDERTFRIEQIAERKGFQILQCCTDEIPVASVCKKLDTKLRKNAENYICIFMVPGTMHHLWVAPVKKVEKRDVVLVEYDTLDKAGFLFEKMESLSFTLEDNPTILDIIEKVQSSFLINSEKITKDFYAGFKKEHARFAQFITGIDDHIADKDNKNKQWYASVMLNRLMFCYFIQKKEFLDGDVDYLRHKLEWTQQNEGEDRFFNKFYKGFLVSLFHDGLNAPQHNTEFEAVYGRIPYLNGGMFDVHQIEQEYARLDIADEAFVSLFDFFDKWHWHLDDRMTATGRDINPDVLGYIFEQYINDRAQMGAYYTKEDITEYIGRNTIVPYLMDAVKRKDEKLFRADSHLWQFLRESGDRYIFDAMKKGCNEPIPDEIAVGIDTTKPNLLERRSHWNERTLEPLALPTEIWRETIERLERYRSIKAKIEKGEVTAINDFITYNLDIRQFVYDYLAHTPDHLFVGYFYAALQRVTILDPTCGSGAFLFAALNILEPLYEVCINRMQEFNEKNPHLFTNQLQEIENKYRSNIQYFIYKSIILRNLYGVDIMVEATEIAKLRLFLKMVAVVEVDKRNPNLGLDPLPDIDFNIRCGNTLVGYATQKELETGIAFSDLFTAEEFRNKVSDEMDKVARTYEVFKTIQLSQAEDMAAFKRAKHELKVRLTALNDLLNRQMYGAVDAKIDYTSWLASHQPFHWLAEFYEIINGNGGFDVIIGNPPYVSKNKINYLANDTFKCSDLYGYVIKRILQLLSPFGTHGFIVMHNLAFSRNFAEVRNLLNNFHGSVWYSFYSRIPSGLFSGDVRVRNCIYLLSSTGNEKYTSCLHRWFSEQRAFLFSTTIKYNYFVYSGVIPMLDSEIIQSIYENKRGNNIATLEDSLNGNSLYYKKVGYNFLSISNIKPNAFDSEGNTTPQTKLGTLKFLPQYYNYIQLLCCGKLYISKWLTYGDDFDVTGKDITSFSFPFDEINVEDKNTLESLYEEFCRKLPSTIQYKLNAGIKVGTFNTSALWNITDKSDMIFLSYLTDSPLLAHEVIENHLAKCIISDK